MLQFVTGTAGTGKTSYLLGELERVVCAGGQAVLLVPEQYSFEGERLVYRALGPAASMRVEVLSFTRLCNSIFRTFGGLAGVQITQTGRYLLMSVAVAELREHLKIYRSSCSNSAFLDTLVSACAEFKTAGLRPERLEALAGELTGSPLGDKLADLSALYAAYQALIERGYADPDDDLLRACRLLERHDYFGGRAVFVDGFATFMNGEFQLLRHVIAQADRALFAFPAGPADENDGGLGLFSPSAQAMRRLRRFAQEAGVETAVPVRLMCPRRYQNEALAHISEQFLQPGAEPFEGDSAAIRLHRAADPYRELEWVAAHIAALVREQGCRYREIAVVARDTGPYLRALDSVFGHWELPFFTDAREPVESKPLIGGLLAAIEAVRSNFDGPAVAAYAKSPITGLDAEAVAAMENYCYAWNVRGRLWESEWRNNPRGMVDFSTEADHLELAALNETRRAVIEPLLALRDALDSGNGMRFARGLYDFLERIGASGHLVAFAGRLPQGEREAFLDESAQLWDMLMDILDVFGSVLGGTKLSGARLCELLRLSVASAEVAAPPQMLDEIIVGTANRIRPGQVRAVFVIGANEGIFPADCGAGGVFTDEERQQMIDLGAGIGAPTLGQAVLEKYYAYFALTLPSESLYVSYPAADTAGSARLPSVIVSQLQALFPALCEEALDEFAAVGGDKTAFELLARRWREDTPQTAALRAYFSGGEALGRVRQAADKPQHALRDPAVVRGLFGRSMRLSPSRIERYYRCPYSYFLQDGLRARARGRVEFSPLESGNVLHYVLQAMVQRYGKDLFTLPDDRLEQEIRELIFGYLRRRVEHMDTLPVRFRYLFGRLAGALSRLLRHLGSELAQSSFEPAEFELSIRRGGEVEPLELTAPDGSTVYVEGVVDRVDIMERGGKKYVRVVDYKSGGKQFRLEDVLCGLNLQMLLYLFTISENGGGRWAGAEPAGVLYMPVLGRYVSAQRTTPDEQVRQEQAKQWRMSGLLLEDEQALRGMERDLRGLFIPARVKKDGTLDAKSSLAGKAEMGRLSRKVREMIAQMAQSLGQGGIESRPVDSPDYPVCEYCEYAAVCGFEQGDEVRTIARMDDKEVFSLLREEYGDA